MGSFSRASARGECLWSRCFWQRCGQRLRSNTHPLHTRTVSTAFIYLSLGFWGGGLPYTSTIFKWLVLTFEPCQHVDTTCFFQQEERETENNLIFILQAYENHSHVCSWAHMETSEVHRVRCVLSVRSSHLCQRLGWLMISEQYKKVNVPPCVTICATPELKIGFYYLCGENK